MKDELQRFTPTGLPSTVVNQQGEKNVHIDHAETVNQNITINFPYMRRASGSAKPSSRTINPNYYNLFVMGGEDYEQDHFLVPADRALPYYWTSEELRKKYGSLTDEAIEEIKTFPALFMAESTGYYAKAGDEQQAFLGFVDAVRVQDNGIKIRCQLVLPIPMQQICDIGFELGMRDMEKALTEVNRTHWSIKRINLIEELKDANINLWGL